MGSNAACAGSDLSRTVREGRRRSGSSGGRASAPAPGEADKLAKLGLKHAVYALTRPVPYQLVGPEPKDERNRALAPADAVGHDHLSWLDRMVRTTAPMVERMTLIWHDWFATSNLGVASQRLMLDQVDFFRGNAFGSFKDILLSVTKDPAMLVWLNGNQNIRQRPNENYARELMELFTLGANRGAYTETDVREQARALTGWQGNVVNRQSTGFTFNAARHDTGNKTIFGKTGNFSWEDSCQLCLDNPAHPSFFVEKMWSYFIPTKIDSADLDGAAGDGTPAGWCGPWSSRSCCTPRSTRARAWPSRRSSSTPACCGCAAATSTPRPGGRSASRRASSSSTRRTSAAGTTRAGSTPPPSAHAGSSPRVAQADSSTPTDSPSDPAQAGRPRAPVLGHADAHADDAGRC